MGYKRNLSPANAARAKKADAFAVKVYAEIWELHEQGASLDEMSTHLIDCGLKTRGGALYWEREQVARVLRRVKERHLWP